MCNHSAGTRFAWARRSTRTAQNPLPRSCGKANSRQFRTARLRLRDAFSLNAPGSPQTANQVKPQVATLGGVNQNPYFDPLAFSSVTGPVFGTVGYNTLRGPANKGNLDLNLTRSFRLTEKLQLQFRAEAFNATNSPHWWSPGTRANSYTTSFTNNVSSMQLSPAGSVLNLNGYDQIVYVNALGRDYDERYFRLGLRLSF